MNVESVRLKQTLARPAFTVNEGPGVVEKGSWIARIWAFILCPTVLLLSYVPLLNLFARGVLMALAFYLTSRKAVIRSGWFSVRYPAQCR